MRERLLGRGGAAGRAGAPARRHAANQRRRDRALHLPGRHGQRGPRRGGHRVDTLTREGARVRGGGCTPAAASSCGCWRGRRPGDPSHTAAQAGGRAAARWRRLAVWRERERAGATHAQHGGSHRPTSPHQGAARASTARPPRWPAVGRAAGQRRARHGGGRGRAQLLHQRPQAPRLVLSADHAAAQDGQQAAATHTRAEKAESRHMRKRSLLLLVPSWRVCSSRVAAWSRSLSRPLSQSHYYPRRVGSVVCFTAPV